MIKKIIISFVVFLTLLFAWRNLIKEDKVVVVPKVTPIPTVPKQIFREINFSDQKYAYQYFKGNISRLKILINPKRESSLKLVNNNGCQSAINGGFYDTQNQPLGLIIAKDQLLSDKIQSILLDGFIVIDENKKITISREIPEVKIMTAMQSGPMLFINGVKLSLTIKDDKPARRMVALKDSNEELIFLTVFEPGHFLYGPDLADLPEILSLIAEKENFEIISAVNLDGGSASFFLSPDLTLSEYNPVGSLFCQE